MTRSELAIMELNRKLAVGVTLAMQKKMSEHDALKAVLETTAIKDDIQRYEERYNEPLHVDWNYSLTIGPFSYGAYQFLEDMEDVSTTVESGI